MEKNNNCKIACVSGTTGQMGSYILEMLLEKGYMVYGMKRRSSSFNTSRIDHLINHPNLKLVYGDVCDFASVSSFIMEHKPELFFNLAAQSHVKVSFDLPTYTMEATGNSVLNCLEAIRKYSPKTKFVTTSSSEMFGKSKMPQNEDTLFQPQSPYAIAKLMGYHCVKNYREAYGLHASNAICFNTESPRRGETFFPKKLVMGAVRCKLGLQDKLILGNLNSFRDFTHAKDTVNGLYKIINAEKPDDFVIASGKTQTMQKLTETVFNKLGMNWKDYVVIDPSYYRPLEVDELCGDPTKIKKILGWEPEYDVDSLLDEMIAYDLELAKKDLPAI